MRAIQNRVTVITTALVLGMVVYGQSLNANALERTPIEDFLDGFPIATSGLFEKNLYEII